MIAMSTTSLFLDLHDLQRDGVMVDTRLVLDDGDLSIHWSMLDLYGYQQWWTGLEVTIKCCHSSRGVIGRGRAVC